MKNIIDIYESVLSKTKDKVNGVKGDLERLSLKDLDNYKYRNLFNPYYLEDTLFALKSWKATDKEIIGKILKDSLHDIPCDEYTIDVFYRLINIHMKQQILEQWMYYYKDEKSAATADVDVLKSSFKPAKIYKGYTPKQKEMRQRSVYFWQEIDNAEKYVSFYYNSNVYWLYIPKTLNGEDKVFMENFMNLMVKFNK